MRVRITSGSYGADNGRGGVRVIDRGQTCDVDENEARRLVSLGVAVIEGGTPLEPVAMPASDAGAPGAGKDTSESGKPLEGTAEGDSAQPEQLQAMTYAQLKTLAESMGIGTAKLRSKTQLITAITAQWSDDADEEEPDADDGDAPPELGAEEPIV